MTVNTVGYTVGANQPLNHARILWDMIGGGITATGVNGIFAANDYTAQRWMLSSGFNFWGFLTASNLIVDCVVIAGHNLSGKTITVSTSPDVSGGFTMRATIVPPDNSPIMVLFNSALGAPLVVRQVYLNVLDAAADSNVAIIRAGVALQMPIPIYGGHKPIGQNRVTEGQHLFSETGQWLGRTAKRLAQTSSYAWNHVKSDWYAANFEPFAKTLPLKPFAIAGNPLRMPEDVGWCFTNSDIDVAKMGVLDHVEFSLNVTGFAG